MTLAEKAKEKFGEDYVKECPAEQFGICCLANNDHPDCHTKGCWEYHRINLIEFKENPKEIFRQQIEID